MKLTLRKWWWRGVVTKGSGDDGKWWRRGVVTKGSGDEGKWWRWEVVRKGSSEEGKRWRREVVTMGSGDDGKWWGREVVSWGEAGARNLVFFRVKWLQPAMKGTSSVRRVRLRSVYRFFLPQCNGGFKLLWVCLCVRSYRVFGICACRSHWNGCMMLQGLCFGEEAGAQNLVFFRVKWLQATMKGTSSVRRVRLRSVYRFFFAAA